MMLRKNATRIQTNLPTVPWFGFLTIETSVMMKTTRPITLPKVRVMGSMPTSVPTRTLPFRRRRPRAILVPMRSRPLVAVVVVLGASLLTMTGCAPTPEPEPEPTPTSASPTPEPTETADADAPAIVLDGDSLDVVRGDEVLASYTFDQTAPEVMAAMNIVLGENATSETITDDPCYPSVDRTSWGGLHLWSSTEGVNKPLDAQYFVTVDAAETASGVPIRMPSGQEVGESAAVVLDANIGAPSFAADEGSDLYYDVRSGTPDGDASEFYGALARLQRDELVELRSPVYYLFEC